MMPYLQRAAGEKMCHLSPPSLQAGDCLHDALAAASDALGVVSSSAGTVSLTLTPARGDPVAWTLARASASAAHRPRIVRRSPAAAAPRVAVALYDRTGENGDELSFQAGDRIVVAQIDGGGNDWWKGSLERDDGGGEEEEENKKGGIFLGKFPRTFVRLERARAGSAVDRGLRRDPATGKMVRVGPPPLGATVSLPGATGDDDDDERGRATKRHSKSKGNVPGSGALGSSTPRTPGKDFKKEAFRNQKKASAACFFSRCDSQSMNKEINH